MPDTSESEDPLGPNKTAEDQTETAPESDREDSSPEAERSESTGDHETGDLFPFDDTLFTHRETSKVYKTRADRRACRRNDRTET